MASEVRYGVGLRPLFLVDDGREWDDNDGMDLEDFITVAEACELLKDTKHQASRVAISGAARRWYESKSESGIAGTTKRGNIYFFPRESFWEWVRNRKPRGPKPTDLREE
jgi:hypothetical protein